MYRIMDIITIFLPDIELNQLKGSKIEISTIWKYSQKEIKNRVGLLPFVQTYLDVYINEDGYYSSGKAALKELIRIIENEKLNIGRINYHYSYFYKEQCNIEFDEEYISLFSKLKCFITIICSKDE